MPEICRLVYTIRLTESFSKCKFYPTFHGRTRHFMTNEEPLSSHIDPSPSLGAALAGDFVNTSTPFRRRQLNRVSARQAKYDAASAPGIGTRLDQRRLQLQPTQAEVAAAVSFQFKSGKRKHVETPHSRNAYCMYELGKVEPSLKTIVGLAHVLRSSPEWLAFGTGRKSSSSKRYPPEDVSNGDARIGRTL